MEPIYNSLFLVLILILAIPSLLWWRKKIKKKINQFLDGFGWEHVGKGTAQYRKDRLGFTDNYVPFWIRKMNFPYRADVVYYLKGKTFRYKILVTRPGEQGSPFIFKLYRKLRKK